MTIPAETIATTPEGSVTDPERLSPLDSVAAYLGHLSSGSLEELGGAVGMLDDVLHDNSTSIHRFGDARTYVVVQGLVDFNHRPLHDRRRSLCQSASAAAVQVVKSMIQGGKFPVEDFTGAIGLVSQALDLIHTKWGSEPVNPRTYSGMIQAEVTDVWKSAVKNPRNPSIMRRAAEAYRLTGGYPFRYGLMMARVARAEAKRK